MGAKRGALFPSLIEGKSESSASDSLVACVCDDWEQLLVGLRGGLERFILDRPFTKLILYMFGRVLRSCGA